MCHHRAALQLPQMNDCRFSSCSSLRFSHFDRTILDEFPISHDRGEEKMNGIEFNSLTWARKKSRHIGVDFFLYCKLWNYFAALVFLCCFPSSHNSRWSHKLLSQQRKLNTATEPIQWLSLSVSLFLRLDSQEIELFHISSPLGA